MQNSKFQLVIPMSGQGVRYQKAGYTDPKPLISVNGTPMIERVLSQYPLDWTSTFILAENHRTTKLPTLLKELRPGCQVLFVQEHSKGPGHALAAAVDHLDKNARVVVSYCDFGMVWDARQFERFVQSADCDACVPSYRGFHAHYLTPTMYAYSRLENGKVVEIKEKGCFTDNRENEFASCGIYYFKNVNTLKRALKYQEKDALQLNGESYTSLTVQALIANEPTTQTRVFEIPYFFQWGTPEDLKGFEYWERCFNNYEKNRFKRASVENVLMPMAGLGSRFESMTHVPKPFIPLGEKPMFENALDSLPEPNNTAVLVVTENIQCQYLTQLPAYQKKYKSVVLAQTPNGQALSTREGLNSIEGDIVISSCDHGIVLNAEKFMRMQKSNMFDAAIFCVKGFPGASRRPQAFAYVKVKDSKDIPEVEYVSVKTPISNHPTEDFLLVGTFWFKSQKIVEEGIQLLIEKQEKVNSEFYLDSIFNILLEKNYKVCVIPLDGYICWGDPDALAESLYWQEVFQGARSLPRAKFPIRFNEKNCEGK